jgi:hypothetical protein
MYDMLSALRDGERPSVGSALSWRADLTQAMYDMLSALRDGEPLGRALARGAKSYPGTPEELQSEVHRWFREWASEGLFTAVER